MKFTSQIIAAASGSVGGATFSRNRFGQYVRARAVPVNPNSNPQQVVRTIMNDLSSRWVENLTQVQRDAWELYAFNTPITSVIGQSIQLTGLNMYVRSNLARMQAGQTRLDDAPTIFDVGGFSPVLFDSATEAGQTVRIDITNTDSWAAEDDSMMLVYISRPQNAGKQFFRGPYRLAGIILGDAMTPPTAIQNLPAPFPFVSGQKVFARVAVSRIDGRYSFSQRGFVIAGA